MRVLPCGRRALLVELDDLEAVLGLHAALAPDLPVGVTELVPAARTLLVAFDPAATDAGRLAAALRERPFTPGVPRDGPLVEIPVTYDGEDLEVVAGQAGLRPEEVAATHAAGEYVVAFSGFAPGFGYLTGLDERLHVPRRDTPRTRVPAGAVAIADRFSAVYPRASPGGWQLIGRTELELWDARRDPPAVLAPGTRVRFVEAGAAVTSAEAKPAAGLRDRREAG
jgi:KipI family sensor histidine kinase inhibitor